MDHIVLALAAAAAAVATTVVVEETEQAVLTVQGVVVLVIQSLEQLLLPILFKLTLHGQRLVRAMQTTQPLLVQGVQLTRRHRMDMSGFKPTINAVSATGTLISTAQTTFNKRIKSQCCP